MVELTPELLAGGPFFPGGRDDIAPVWEEPEVRWAVVRERHEHTFPDHRERRIFVTGSGLVLGEVQFYYEYYNEWYGGYTHRGFVVYDPDTGDRRWASDLPLWGIEERTVVASRKHERPGQQPEFTKVGYDLETGMINPVTAATATWRAFPEFPGGQLTAVAGAVEYTTRSTAAGSMFATHPQRGDLWEVDVVELLRPYTPESRGSDGGFAVQAMTPTPGRLYVVTSAGDLICLAPCRTRTTTGVVDA